MAQEDPKTFVPLLNMTMQPPPKVPQEGGTKIDSDPTLGHHKPSVPP
jgi:hypothetical protein